MEKNTLEKKYKKILQAKINRKGRSRDTLSNSMDKICDASDLMEFIHKKVKNRKLIQEARKQFIITLVTSIEVLLRDYFLVSLTYENIINKFRKISDYSERKFTLAEMVFCNENKISEQELIADNYNFQNISDINKAFSTALSNNFFDDIKNFKWWFDKKIKKQDTYS